MIITLAFLPFCAVTLLLALIARSHTPSSYKDVRMVWGPSSIINNKYWSNAMKQAGFSSQTLMKGYSDSINKQADYDEYVADRYNPLPLIIKLPILFWESLFRFVVFVLSYNGWLLGAGPKLLWRLEPFFLRLAGKKIVIIPYGSDGYVYRNIRSPSLLHGLLMSYPAAAKIQDKIEAHVRLWTQQAHCVVPVIMGVDGIGRWDTICLSPVCIDTGQWIPSERNSEADGKNDAVYVVHAPNHTGVKGTEFIVDAVEQLKEEGLKVDLILLQKIQNDEVRQILQRDADILVEQLICTGHGINAVEGMASSLPVDSNLEDELYTTIFRRWSFLKECPLVAAAPETVVDQLRKLVTRPELRKQLGVDGRRYVEKYHSYDSGVYLFENILKYVYGELDSIINLYHPLLSDYNKRVPVIVPPLADNRIE